MGQKELHPLILRTGPREDDAVRQLVAHDMQDRAHRVFFQFVLGDRDVVAGAAQRLGDARDHRAGEAENLAVGIEDEADHLGSPGAEALGRPVGDVADFGGHTRNGVPRGLGNAGVVGERARDGRYGEAGQGRDGAQCGFQGPVGAARFDPALVHAPLRPSVRPAINARFLHRCNG